MAAIKFIGIWLGFLGILGLVALLGVAVSGAAGDISSASSAGSGVGGVRASGGGSSIDTAAEGNALSTLAAVEEARRERDAERTAEANRIEATSEADREAAEATREAEDRNLYATQAAEYREATERAEISTQAAVNQALSLTAQASAVAATATQAAVSTAEGQAVRLTDIAIVAAATKTALDIQREELENDRIRRSNGIRAIIYYLLLMAAASALIFVFIQRSRIREIAPDSNVIVDGRVVVTKLAAAQVVDPRDTTVVPDRDYAERIKTAVLTSETIRSLPGDARAKAIEGYFGNGRNGGPKIEVIDSAKLGDLIEEAEVRLLPD